MSVRHDNIATTNLAPNQTYLRQKMVAPTRFQTRWPTRLGTRLWHPGVGWALSVKVSVAPEAQFLHISVLISYPSYYG